MVTDTLSWAASLGSSPFLPLPLQEYSRPSLSTETTFNLSLLCNSLFNWYEQYSHTRLVNGQYFDTLRVFSYIWYGVLKLIGPEFFSCCLFLEVMAWRRDQALQLLVKVNETLTITAPGNSFEPQSCVEWVSFEHTRGCCGALGSLTMLRVRACGGSAGSAKGSLKAWGNVV